MTTTANSVFSTKDTSISNGINTHVITTNGINAVIFSSPITNNRSQFTGECYGGDFKDLFLGGPNFNIVYQLLMFAIKNRTIERDFFKLYSSFVEGLLTEDEFNDEINSNEDKYVIQSNIIPGWLELKLALELSKEIPDCTNSEDFASLFSFNSYEIENELKRITQK